MHGVGDRACEVAQKPGTEPEVVAGASRRNEILHGANGDKQEVLVRSRGALRRAHIGIFKMGCDQTPRYHPPAPSPESGIRADEPFREACAQRTSRAR